MPNKQMKSDKSEELVDQNVNDSVDQHEPAGDQTSRTEETTQDAPVEAQPVEANQEESTKSETDKAISEVESATEVGDSTDSDSQRTHNEAQEPSSGPENSEPSRALQSDEPTPIGSGEEIASSSVTPRNDDQHPDAKWYVVHTYSGHENKVAATLKQRIESEKLENKIFEVLVPMQDKIEIRAGKKTEVKEKIFPGYILVKMILDDQTWLAVRTTQGVTSFVGMGNKPTPIPESEVQTIVRFTQIQQPTFKQIFAADDTVKIVDGPFAEFIGKVDSVDEEKGKVKVLVSIFGRETPVELDFLQVQKI